MESTPFKVTGEFARGVYFALRSIENLMDKLDAIPDFPYRERVAIGKSLNIIINELTTAIGENNAQPDKSPT